MGPGIPHIRCFSTSCQPDGSYDVHTSNANLELYPYLLGSRRDLFNIRSPVDSIDAGFAGRLVYLDASCTNVSNLKEEVLVYLNMYISR